MTRQSPIKRFDTRAGVRIYRISCQVLPDLTGRVHLLLGAGPPTLVDCGSAGEPSTGQLFAGFDRLRKDFHESFRLADVRRILITHSHADHIGGLAELVRRTAAAVGVHPLEVPPIRDFDAHAVVQGRRTLDFLRTAGVADDLRPQLLNWFGLRKGRVQSARVDFHLADREPLDGILPLHTPGHSPGHLCLRLDEILLSADHVLAVTVPQQWPESLAAYTGLAHYLDSLARVAAEPGLELALGGHEAPIRDVYHRVEQIRQTQFRRLNRVLDLLGKASRPLSIAELAEQMYAQTQGIHRLLAIMDAGSRVEYLFDRGQAAIVNLDEVETAARPVPRYRPA